MSGMAPVLVFVLCFVFSCVDVVQARTIAVSWTGGGIVLNNLTSQDTLVFSYSNIHNVVVASSQADYDGCTGTGTQICGFNSSPCSVNLAPYAGTTLRLYCAPHCSVGFKSVFGITTLAPSVSPITSAPTSSPSQAPSYRSPSLTPSLSPLAPLAEMDLSPPQCETPPATTSSWFSRLGDTTPRFGEYVAMSLDGTTAAVTAMGDNSHSGAVFVYVRDIYNRWRLQSGRLFPQAEPAGYVFGSAVALNADGNILIVGSPFQDGVGAGYVFTRDSGGVWTQFQKIIPQDPSVTGQKLTGTSVAINADGTRLVLGTPGRNNSMGGAFVFERNATSQLFIQNGEVLFGTNSSVINGHAVVQGYACVMDQAGTVLAISGTEDLNGIGAAWIFGRNESTGEWSQLQDKLQVLTGSGINERNGFRLLLSADATLLIVSSLDGRGIHFWQRVGATWMLLPQRLQGDLYFGAMGLALSSDASVLYIGSPYEDSKDRGCLYTFVRNITGLYAQVGGCAPPPITLAEEAAQHMKIQWYGMGVATSGNGRHLIVGASLTIYPPAPDFIGYAFAMSVMDPLICQADSISSLSTSGPSISPSTSLPTMTPTHQPSNVPSTPTTRSPTTRLPTVSPSKHLTSIPTVSPSRSKPTVSPTRSNPTKSPTAAPSIGDAEGPPNRLVVFIQMDHSGSIREANPRCRLQSGSTCWELMVEFVENLVNRLVVQVGGYENFALHLSYFSCVPKSARPIYKLLTRDPVAVTAQQVQDAIAKLKQVSDENMYGTCPSLGAESILQTMQSVNLQKSPWPMSYYVITDGLVQDTDRDEYSGAMRQIKQQVQRFDSKRNTVCAMTIGNAALKRDLQSLIKSDCIDTVEDFMHVTDMQVALQAADELLAFPSSPTDPPSSATTTTSLPTDENGNTPPPSTTSLSTTTSSSSSSSSDSSIAAAASAGAVVAVLGGIGIVVFIKRYNRGKNAMSLASSPGPSATAAASSGQLIVPTLTVASSPAEPWNSELRT